MDTSEELIKVIRGRPFDSEGGGGAGKFSRDRLSAGKFISRYTKARLFIFIRKKKRKNRGGDN